VGAWPSTWPSSAGRFQILKTAAFLFHEVELNAADRFDGGENFLPGRNALAEENTVAFLLGGIAGAQSFKWTLLMRAGMRLDPRDRIGARFEARATSNCSTNSGGVFAAMTSITRCLRPAPAIRCDDCGNRRRGRAL